MRAPTHRPTHAASPPNRRQLFADPQVRVVWAAVRELDVADRHLILAELREQLAIGGEQVSDHDRRRARGIADVRAAADLMTSGAEPRSLSVDAYRDVRRLHP